MSGEVILQVRRPRFSLFLPYRATLLMRGEELRTVGALLSKTFHLQFLQIVAIATMPCKTLDSIATQYEGRQHLAPRLRQQ